MRSSHDLTTRARIRDAAIEQFGQRGFDVGLRTIAQAADVSAALVIHHFGSKDGLRAACDELVAESIRRSKSDSLPSTDPASWLAQLADLESFAPMMAYLVRTLQSGGALARTLWQTMIDDAEQYLEDGVRAGTVKPSRDPRARARFLTMAGMGGFLVALQLHDDPADMRAVLRDHADTVLLPAMEVYTHGLMADSTRFDALTAARDGVNHDE